MGLEGYQACTASRHVPCNTCTVTRGRHTKHINELATSSLLCILTLRTTRETPR